VLLSAALLGTLKYVPRLVQLRSAGEAVRRAASSVWNLDPFTRGRQIEQFILGGLSRLGSNFPVIDDYIRGVATSIKSLDLTAATYQSGPRLISRLASYAGDLARFAGARRGTLLIPPRGESIVRRVLVVAFEDGALTVDQARALAEFARRAPSAWPNVTIVFTFIP